jgi:DNA-binding NtrC family response regulator
LHFFPKMIEYSCGELALAHFVQALARLQEGERRMNARLLVAESDWHVLSYVYRDLSEHGYDVMVEPDVEAAQGVLSHWWPDMVIISGHHLKHWEMKCPELINELMSRSVLLVTVSPEDEAGLWDRWLHRGCEILFKPLVHASELRAAADAAMLTKLQRYRPNIGRLPGTPGVYGSSQAG